MIDLEFVIGVNEAICDSDNKQCVVINESNILSALSVQQWYDDAHLASALLRSLVIGHGFQDGNKRTAAAVANHIYSFQCDDSTAEDCILEVAKGNLKDVNDITSILYLVDQ